MFLFLLQTPLTEMVTPEQLLGVAGVAVVTALITGMFVKKRLRLHYNLPPSGSLDGFEGEQKAKYSWALNIVAFVVALALSFVAQWIFSEAVTAEVALLAFLNALFAAAMSVGFAEWGSNTISRFSS
jgi:hypothetical protein